MQRLQAETSRLTTWQGQDFQATKFHFGARFLAQDRPQEADMLLTRALAMDPKNPFTLNNFGFAKETEGELENAERYYQQAADLHSEEPVLVTTRKDWALWSKPPFPAMAASRARSPAWPKGGWPRSCVRRGYYVVAPEPGIWSYPDEKGVWHRVEEPAWRMEKKI